MHFTTWRKWNVNVSMSVENWWCIQVFIRGKTPVIFDLVASQKSYQTQPNLCEIERFSSVFNKCCLTCWIPSWNTVQIQGRPFQVNGQTNEKRWCCIRLHAKGTANVSHIMSTKISQLTKIGLFALIARYIPQMALKNWNSQYTMLGNKHLVPLYSWMRNPPRLNWFMTYHKNISWPRPYTGRPSTLSFFRLLVLCFLGRFKCLTLPLLSLLGFFFSFLYPSTIIQSSIICLGL